MTMWRSPRRVSISFHEALAAAAAIAARSPSSHNCQPWALAHVVSDLARRRAVALCGDSDADGEFLLLMADRTRELVTLPAHHVEMQLSCGLFWRLLERAMAAQGWMVRGVITPAAADLGVLGVPTDRRPLRLARFERTDDPTESFTRLRNLAAARHTDRGPYLDRPIPREVLDTLKSPSADSTQPISVRLLTSESDRSRFARFVARNASRDFTDSPAWRETHSFIRRSEAEARELGDGFTFTQLFGPMSRPQTLLRRIVLAPVTMRALSRTGLPEILARQLAAIVRRTPVVVMLTLPTPSVDDEQLLAAGEALTDFWLRVTDAGLVLHPISIVVQHDDLRNRLQAEFSLSGLVFFAARLGYSTGRFPPSPRRDPADSLRVL